MTVEEPDGPPSPIKDDAFIEADRRAALQLKAKNDECAELERRLSAAEPVDDGEPRGPDGSVTKCW